MSGLDLIWISLTLVPTNSKKDAESLFSMPSTADESVKYLTASSSMCSEWIILCASLTTNKAPTSSILGMDILHLGATLVLPARRRHCTDPSAICHLRYASGQLAKVDPSPKIIRMGLPMTGSRGLAALGNVMALRSARCFTTSWNSLLVPSGTGSSHPTTRPVDSSARLLMRTLKRTV